MTKELICISCPIGCNLTVTIEQGQVSAVEGNICKRGRQYAEDECIRPMRMLTTTVNVKGCKTPVAVKSSRAIPKDQLPQAVRLLKGMLFPAPVATGDILARDFQGLDADIVATQSSFSQS